MKGGKVAARGEDLVKEQGPCRRDRYRKVVADRSQQILVVGQIERVVCRPRTSKAVRSDEVSEA